MAWEGLVIIGGTEVANNTRVVQYAETYRLPWMRSDGVNDYLPLMLGDGPRYRTPMLDDAPWTDPDVPESYEFLGFYCLGIDGLESSSRTAPVTEYISDGGSAGRIRHATKSVVVDGLIVALTDAGADYGMRWLRQATLGGPCDSSPFGGDLCYLSASPELDIPDSPAMLALIDGGYPDLVGVIDVDGGDPSTVPDETYDGGDPYHSGGVIEHSEDIFVLPSPISWDPTECLTPYQRTLRKFKVVGGPSLSQKYPMQRGALWAVQFTGVAGVPWEFGSEVGVISGFLGDDPTGVAIDLDTDGTVVSDADCATVIWGPMVDPLCPVLVSPPGPVNVPLGCVDIPSSWLRRQFTIPAASVPVWSDMVPILDIHAPAAVDLRNLRVRFYSDPFDEGDPSADPCAYCGDMLISYVPAGATMTIDAASEAVYVTLPGGIQRRADSLVFGTDQKPFDWPSLTCGFAYTVTVDLPQIQEPPVLDLALIPRAR